MKRLYVLALAALPLGCQDNPSSNVAASNGKKDVYEVCLDGKEIDSVEKFHKSIKEQADFSHSYAENMDALSKELLNRTTPVYITWYNYEKSRDALDLEGGSFLQMKRVIAHAYENGARVSLKLIDELDSPESPCEVKPVEDTPPVGPGGFPPVLGLN